MSIGCTLGELGRRMSSQEFSLWFALWQREPFGEMRADLRAGVIASTIANYAGRVRDAQAGAAVPSDFMVFAPRDESAPEPDAVEHFKGL